MRCNSNNKNTLITADIDSWKWLNAADYSDVVTFTMLSPNLRIYKIITNINRG